LHDSIIATYSTSVQNEFIDSRVINHVFSQRDGIGFELDKIVIDAQIFKSAN